MGGENEEGLFHKRDEIYRKATTEGHYMPLFRRVEKIMSTLEDIIRYQDYEIGAERRFEDLQRWLYNAFFNLTMIELFVVSLTAGYSVWTLRQFYVRKAIY